MPDFKKNDKFVNIRELIKTEYVKCASDPKYFMKKYCYIQHPVKGRILFDLYPYQEQTVDQIDAHLFNVVLKARQIGISTVVSCYALWLMLFHRDKNVLAIATKQSTAKNIILKVKFAFDNLPIWLKSPCIENNQLSLRFKNGSQIKASSSSNDSGRSEALSMLIIDECAHIRNAEDIWLAAQATLATGGKGILISTPNGVGNFFHQTWEKAESGLNQFNKILLDWSVHPDRDENWKARQIANYGGDERKFRQEYGAEFLGSGNTVVDADMVEYYRQTYVKDPIFKQGFDGNLWVWEPVNYSKKYMVVADVARGDGSDYSAFHVLEIESCTQVAEYKGKLDTTLFGNLLVEIGTTYNDALLVIENASSGWAAIQQVINRSYRNLFYMTDDIRVVEEVDRKFNNKYYRQEKKQVPGFTTSNRTRPLIISKLDEYIRNKSVTIRSIRTINELQVFIWEKGKAQAQAGYNDDLVMALSIALWVRDTSLEIFTRNSSLSQLALDNIQRTTYEPVITKPTNITYDPFIMPNTRDGEDFRWLLQ
jgi:hypothetical protein